MHRARSGRITSTAPDRPAAATLRTNREDNENNVPLHRRGLQNWLPTKLLQNNDPTMNRPEASRPTPNRPGVQGSKREQHPMGWQQHAAPSPPATIPTNAPQHRDSSIRQPTNQPKQPTSNPRPQSHNASPLWAANTGTFARRSPLRAHRLRDGLGRNSASRSRKKPNDDQADQKAAETPRHQRNGCGNNGRTTNRPHTSRPTSNQPDMQGSIRERRPAGWRRHGETGPTTTIPTYTTVQRDPTITQTTNLWQRTTSTPGPPGERNLDRVRRRECAPRHVSSVARASSSRPTPTENQPRWGCLQDRAFGLAPGSWAPEFGD